MFNTVLPSLDFITPRNKSKPNISKIFLSHKTLIELQSIQKMYGIEILNIKENVITAILIHEYENNIKNPLYPI
jgi:hypothetical protein